LEASCRSPESKGDTSWKQEDCTSAEKSAEQGLVLDNEFNHDSDNENDSEEHPDASVFDDVDQVFEPTGSSEPSPPFPLKA